MAIENEIHPIQINILLFLLFHPMGRYGQLNVLKVPSDQFNFHLKKLQEVELVRKKEGAYQLTAKGKEFANRFDTDKGAVERQAKVAVVVIGTKLVNNKIYFLMQQRLKQPYFGFYGFISGKIRWGETVYETAERELKEETGLTATLKLVAVDHKIDYSKDNNLLEDKFFFVFKASYVKGKLITSFDGGKNIWLLENDVKNLPDLFHDVMVLIDFVKKGTLSFYEKKYKVNKY
jgi:8-oxo-dGTP pyrophosphatase MutT (NUDIX family)